MALTETFSSNASQKKLSNLCLGTLSMYCELTLHFGENRQNQKIEKIWRDYESYFISRVTFNVAKTTTLNILSNTLPWKKSVCAAAEL